jgi:hypothetical protein
VPDGVIVTLPALVVVWFPFIAMFPPITFRFPATEFAPDTVTPAVLLVFPNVRPVVPVNAQVGSNVCAELNEVEEGSIDTVPVVLATTTPELLFAVASLNRPPIILICEEEEPDPSAPK